jgi:hypothetical protein
LELACHDFGVQLVHLAAIGTYEVSFWISHKKFSIGRHSTRRDINFWLIGETRAKSTKGLAPFARKKTLGGKWMKIYTGALDFIDLGDHAFQTQNSPDD